MQSGIQGGLDPKSREDAADIVADPSFAPSDSLGMDAYSSVDVDSASPTLTADIYDVLERIDERRPVDITAGFTTELSELGLVKEISVETYRELEKQAEVFEKLEERMSSLRKSSSETAESIDELSSLQKSFLRRALLTLTFQGGKLDQEVFELRDLEDQRDREAAQLIALGPKYAKLQKLVEAKEQYTMTTQGYLALTEKGQDAYDQLCGRPSTYSSMALGVALQNSKHWQSHLDNWQEVYNFGDIDEWSATQITKSIAKNGIHPHQYIAAFEIAYDNDEIGPAAATILAIESVERDVSVRSLSTLR